ncbi:hypothetical protein ACO0R3_001007 [Hanseniaspora guilliermondii]
MTQGEVRRSRRFREAPKVDYNENHAYKKLKTEQQTSPSQASKKPIKPKQTKVEVEKNDEYKYIYDGSDSDSSIEEYEFEPVLKPLKVVLGKRIIPPVNPNAVLKDPQFKNNPLDYLNSYRTFIDDTDTTEGEYMKLIGEKQQIFQQINQLKKDKIIIQDQGENGENIESLRLAKPNDFSFVNNLETIMSPETSQEIIQGTYMSNQYTYKNLITNESRKKVFLEPTRLIFKEQNMISTQDHLIKQSIHVQGNFTRFTKFKIRQCKKVASLVEQHFKNLRTAEERKMKEKDKYERQMCKKISGMVKKHWMLARKAVDVLREREIQEREIKDKQRDLKDILDKSSKLLRIQHEGVSDDLLTDKQLKEKYGSLSLSLDGNSSVDDSDSLSLSLEDENYDVNGAEYDERAMEVMKEEYDNTDNDILDESDDSSSDMSDESDSTQDSSDGSDAGETGLSELIRPIESEDEPNEPNEDVLTKDNTFAYEVPVPRLLRATLRTYQKEGLDWLAKLYRTGTNGILADEMGLGKTIQTISLLCHLAEEYENWGPHLVIVPTSVLLNWEMEFKKFAPGLKILSYFGSPQERSKKRKGWNNKRDFFNVVITSYQMAVTDAHIFKRKKWGYLVLDEAHNIKNFKSGRWQALLSLNSQRRLLLTGTPLQNNLTELWALLYFLMPKTIIDGGEMEGFADLDSFQEWFNKPVNNLVSNADTNSKNGDLVVKKLHQILKPYLLRRLKKDVEKQMPSKHEHVIKCKLSKRQRYLYDEFMSRTQTKETLKNGNYLSIINCLMQLRKVCNHPDLFEVRPINTSFAFQKSFHSDFIDVTKKVIKMMDFELMNLKGSVNLQFLNFKIDIQNKENYNKIDMDLLTKLKENNDEFEERIEKLKVKLLKYKDMSDRLDFQDIEKFYLHWERVSITNEINKLLQMKYNNNNRLNIKVPYCNDLVDKLKILDVQREDVDIFEVYDYLINKFCMIQPKALILENNYEEHRRLLEMPKDITTHLERNPFYKIETNLKIEFPDKYLLQYDCGKLQVLSKLLIELKEKGHRVLIFTQMTKVLDILEIFLNYMKLTYMRLDGSTKIKDRQYLTERFNNDDKIFAFILSSRSGGTGINLIGADTVIFYDSDWNPAMDKQCQDRCHRIGQYRDVHIYRLISEFTIEENILNKNMEKSMLNDIVIKDDIFNGGVLKDDIAVEVDDEEDSKALREALKEEREEQENDFMIEEENEGELRHVEEYMMRIVMDGYVD